MLALDPIRTPAGTNPDALVAHPNGGREGPLTPRSHACAPPTRWPASPSAQRHWSVQWERASLRPRRRHHGHPATGRAQRRSGQRHRHGDRARQPSRRHDAASGLLPDNPHAAHIHFGAEARHECPRAGDDANGDNHLNTTEGGPAYGDIVVSLTKTGDTSPKRAGGRPLRHRPGGKINYERGSINVSDAVAQAIVDGKSVVVVHGVDYNKNASTTAAPRATSTPSCPPRPPTGPLRGARSRSGWWHGHRCRWDFWLAG